LFRKREELDPDRNSEELKSSDAEEVDPTTSEICLY
jgi:hypothetical protein